MVTKEYSNALVEVLEVLKCLDEDDRKKIPSDIIKFYEDNKSTDYEFHFDSSKDLTEQYLMNKTKEILAGIYIDYLCENEREKKSYQDKLKKIENRYEAQKSKEFNYDDIFKNNKLTQVDSEEEKSLVVVKKDSLFARILKKLKSLFTKK